MDRNPVTSEYILDFKKYPIEVAWKKLQDHFQPHTCARVIGLLDEFFNCRILEQEEIGLYAARLRTIVFQLRDAGWDEKMNGGCKAELAAGTVVEIEAGVSLFTDPISDVGKCI
ncbi:hypothetical protein TNCV_4201511 [Trichonephila clavipes]|uniref:Uncharacterized protein n=1 Tax=Trichonephila clavipes TaxID=2585209 RepID=A0A8X6WBI3_TRICX|nr:hypothetical protein TNCV_4201511 [Trichonephila clavipes]